MSPSLPTSSSYGLRSSTRQTSNDQQQSDRATCVPRRSNWEVSVTPPKSSLRRENKQPSLKRAKCDLYASKDLVVARKRWGRLKPRKSRRQDQLYPIERILGHRWNQEKLMLYIRWDGYDDGENSWEPEKNLEESGSASLQEYYDQLGGRPVSDSRDRSGGAEIEATNEEYLTTEQMVPERQDSTTASHGARSIQTSPSSIQIIETVTMAKDGELMIQARTNTGQLCVFTRDEAHKQFSEQLLNFYEAHIKFELPI